MVWVGYLGRGEEVRLKRALGEGAQVVTGPGFGLGVRKGGGELTTLTEDAHGWVRAVLGDDVEAGCSVKIDPKGPTAILQRDLFGMHAVYLHRREDCIWFASDLRALLRCLDALP